MSHFYKVYRPNGQVVLSLKSSPCYRDYNFSRINFGEHIIDVYLRKPKSSIYDKNKVTKIQFTDEQVKEYAEKLNSCGFACEFHRLDNEEYPIIRIYEKNYVHKSLVRTCLDFIRLLFESNSDNTLIYYFSLSEEIKKKYDFLLLIQVLNYVNKINAHTLPNLSTGLIIESKDILGYIEKLKKIENSNDFGSMALWRKISDKEMNPNYHRVAKMTIEEFYVNPNDNIKSICKLFYKEPAIIELTE